MLLKICGIRTLEEIEIINKAQVDYAGFVFAEHRQKIDMETAKTLKAALEPNIKSVGVFVDEDEDFIRNIVQEGIIDLVQFHGKNEYKMPCETIKAFRIRTEEDIGETNCDFVLFDSNSEGSSGIMFDWNIIKDYSEKPFFLAGGINITNIRKAIELNPYCIDISSGAEENGKKSFNKIKEIANVIKIR